MTQRSWTLAGYVVEGPLGVGGSSEVWRAHVASTGDPVALKRLRVADAERLRAARTEAALLTTLDHPNLIRLHEVVPQADGIVLVLDLAVGGSLADLLAARGRLTPGEVIATVAPIAAALAYAHRCGVVHGDVTPSNVLFAEYGLPLLADLGVARLADDARPVCTTPAYADPSVAAGALPGPHSDVFMAAAVAVHALTGRPLWPGESSEETLAAAVCGDLDVADRLVAAGVPAPIRDVLATALAIDPSRRGSAADFALELRHAGEPVEIELAAGLPRVAPSSSGRADPVGLPAIAGHTVAGDPVAGHPVATTAEPARPAFERPRPAHAAPVGSPALTRGVRVRPLAPRAVPRPFWRRPAVLVLAATVALGAAGGVAWRYSGRPAGPATATRPQPHASDGTTPEPDPRAALAQLDELRARAFARRDPRLLAEIYLPGPLLDADAALLSRLVPHGCGLVGARTSYRDLTVVDRSAERLVVTATATLAASTLVCGGATTGHARGAGPQLLRIQLVRQAGGYRVATQQAA